MIFVPMLTQSCGGIGGLSEEASTEPGVKGGEPLVPHNREEDARRGGLRPGLVLHELHPVLDQVQGLHEASGGHSGKDPQYFVSFCMSNNAMCPTVSMLRLV